MAEQVQRKAVIKNADMSEEMQQSAVDVASHALSKYNIEKVSQVIDAFFLSRVFLFVSFFQCPLTNCFPLFSNILCYLGRSCVY